MTILTPHDPVDRKLKRVKINLMRDPRFAYWRGIMMVGKTTIDPDVPTACTDGCDEMYGPDLIASQTDKQVAFIVLHENMHKIARDLSIWVKLFEDDAQLANMACDYHHNLLLVDMDPLEKTIAFPTTPDGKRLGLYDERFRGVDVPNIFRILKQEKKSGTGAFAPNGDGATGKENFDNHDWEKAKSRDQATKDKLDKEIDQAARQGEAEQRKLNGKGNGDMDRYLSGLTQPKINWRDVMADFVRNKASGGDDSTWRTPNRRLLGMDILLPSLISYRVGRIGLAADMSGSVGGEETTAVVTEMCKLGQELMPEKIDLMYWDTHVARHEEYDESNILLMPTSTKPKGGGGTSPSCVKQYMKDKQINPDCLVVLTDGYVDSWPDFDCPTLWVVTSKNITAPNGITIHLDITQ
jgi:predicted metal-dependent peptidase